MIQSIFQHYILNTKLLRPFFILLVCTALLIPSAFPLAAQSDLTITTSSLEPGTVGLNYEATLEASGGTAPYSWSLSSGSLPSWADLDPETGVISGTPGAAGTANFTVQVTDSSETPATAAKSLSIAVRSAVTISTVILQSGARGMYYEQVLTASGGTGSYTWSKTSGDLPAGLSMSSNKILGKPTRTGVYEFTVKVTDGNTTAERDLVIIIREAGYTYTWGDNSKGQLGNNSTTGRNVPVQPQDLENDIALVTAGGLHTLALDSNGDVWAWGDNSKGQLGIGSTQNKSVPEIVENLSDATSVSAGYYHSLALDESGDVWAWGDNSKGQLGIGSTVNKNSPVRVRDLEDIVAISSGYNHSLALKSDGTVWAWGDNSKGQLGDGSTTQRKTPVQVKGLGGSGNLTGIVAIAAGQYHNLALKSDGTLLSWGDNSKGQLGDGSTTSRKYPVKVNNLTEIVTVAAGGLHSLAVDSSGFLWAWGDNSKGQLGIGSTTGQKSPQEIDSIDEIQAVAAGSYHSLALDKNDCVWAWGDNSKGQLGIGSTANQNTPELVESLEDSALLIAAGSYNSIVISNAELDIEEPLKITTGSLVDGEVGKSYSQTLKATGGSGDYEWSRVSGSLPDGLSLNSTSGKISGTPTKADDFTFKIKVTDENDSSLTDTVTFTITIDYSDEVNITTGSLVDGEVGKSYSQTLKATGGSGDYEWSRVSGSLPDGLSLNSTSGKISGTPTKAGEFTFKIKVVDQDDDSLSDTASFTIDIEESTSLNTVKASGFSLTRAIQLDEKGYSQNDTEAVTSDGMITISIPKGTRLLDTGEKPLAVLSAAALDVPLMPPSGTRVIAAYTFGPDGAVFSPALTINFEYDDADIPVGVNENTLYLAYYNGSQWEDLSSTVDANSNTVTAKISHFSTYAILGETVSSTLTPGNTPQAPDGGKKPDPTSNWPLIIVIIIIVVLAVLVLYWFKLRRGSRFH